MWREQCYVKYTTISLFLVTRQRSNVHLMIDRVLFNFLKIMLAEVLQARQLNFYPGYMIRIES